MLFAQRVFTESQLARLARAKLVKPWTARIGAGSLCAVRWADGSGEVVFVRMRSFKLRTIEAWIAAGRCSVRGRCEESAYARLVWPDGVEETVDIVRPFDVLARVWIRLNHRYGALKTAYLAGAWASRGSRQVVGHG
jgi:hypothetical protein